ncbi:MAG: hypothetical protein JJD93_09865 [Ilumatobacteraceae bacterium]|nr:hypothetical protein [Ilumatobacteraceae bacterium]
MMRRACSLVAAFSAAALISGCGDDATSTQTPVSNASAAASNAVPAATGSASTAPTPTTAVAQDQSATPTSSTLTVTAVTQETTVTPSAGIDPSMQSLVNQAVADLADRLQIDASKIVAVSAQAMSWPDKSLGCPQPGMAYNQVMVDGALIHLSVNGTSYSYHSGGSRAPFLCQKT